MRKRRKGRVRGVVPVRWSVNGTHQVPHPALTDDDLLRLLLYWHGGGMLTLQQQNSVNVFALEQLIVKQGASDTDKAVELSDILISEYRHSEREACQHASEMIFLIRSRKIEPEAVRKARQRRNGDKTD